MANVKKIPCRVCGKLFVPCAYCQEHSDTFRWRNFACSIECARKYIKDTLDYREALKKQSIQPDIKDAAEEIEPTKKRIKKVALVDTVVEPIDKGINDTENEETK